MSVTEFDDDSDGVLDSECDMVGDRVRVAPDLLADSEPVSPEEAVTEASKNKSFAKESELVGLFVVVTFKVSDTVCDSPPGDTVSLTDPVALSWDRLSVSVKKWETVKVRLVLKDSVSVNVAV